MKKRRLSRIKIFKIAAIAIILLSFSTHIFAMPFELVEKKIIAPAFKTLARSILTLVDIKTTRSKCAGIVERMAPSEFAEDYSLIYPYLAGCKKCGSFPEELTKEESIDILKSIEKKRILRMIAAIPSPIIGYAFKKYVLGMKIKYGKGASNHR